MRYETTARDFFYETSAETLSYYITCDDVTIYSGVAVKRPGEPYLRINVGRRVSDYLSTSMPDFRDFDGVVVPHPEQIRDFGIYDGEGTLLEEYRVLYEFEGYFTFENVFLNDPIDGKADPRQKIFINRESTQEASVEITSEGVFDIMLEGSTVLPYVSGQTSMRFTATASLYDVISDNEWLYTVYPIFDDDTHRTGTLYIWRRANYGNDIREGYLIFKGQDTYGECGFVAGGEKRIKFTQRFQGYFNPSSGNYYADRCRENGVIMYDTDITGLTAEAGAPWIDIKSVTQTGVAYETLWVVGGGSTATGYITIKDSLGTVRATYTIHKSVIPNYNSAVTVDLSYAEATGVTNSVLLCDDDVYLTYDNTWITARYENGKVYYDVDSNETDNDRDVVIYVYREDGVLMQTITIRQLKSESLGTYFEFIPDWYYLDPYSNAVQVYAGIPYYERSYAFVSVPQSGRVSSVCYRTDIPVLDATIERNGVEIGTQRLYPSMGYARPGFPFASGDPDIFEYVFTSNNDSNAAEYTITFNDLSGNRRGTIYGVQPASVPTEYEARDVLSGSSGFNYYRTYGDEKNYWATGNYYATDADAVSAGYPMKGGYPDTPVYFLRSNTAVPETGPQTVTYLQSTGKSFLFGYNSIFSGLSAPDVSILCDGLDGAENPNINFKNFNRVSSIEFMDMPRCLVIAPYSNVSADGTLVLNKRIREMNLWSLTFIGGGTMYSTSGITELYLPNIGCIEENNFYEATDLTDIHLGTTLRFLGIKDISTAQGGQDITLPSHIRFHYLGTKAQFQEKVIFKPRGTYHCTDGDLVV